MRTVWQLLSMWAMVSTVATQNFGIDYSFINRLNDVMQAAFNTVWSTFRPDSTSVANEVTFWCATRKHPDYVQVLFEDPDLDEHIDLSKPVAFLVHGWFDDVNRTWVKTTIADYVKFVDTTACAVDWGKLARAEYSLACSRTEKVGEHLGKFIELLQNNGVGLGNVTIVGHSMGAHIAGFAGTMLKGQVGEIIGLDPAGPGAFFRDNGRLDPSDAQFVQILHTDQGYTGTSIVSGHQDYYPDNGVAPLPGCLVPFLQNGIGFSPNICSHYKAVEYFWASLNPENKFMGVKCQDYTEFRAGRCDNSTSDNFGVHAKRTVNGTLYLTVKSSYPFVEKELEL